MPRTTTPTFGEFYQKDFRPFQIASGRVTGTIDNYDSHVRKMLAEFAEMRLRDITPQVVDRWWVKHSTGHLVGRRNAYSTLNTIMGMAKKYNLTFAAGQNPCQVDGWSTDHSAKPKTYTLDEFKEVRSLLKPHLQAPVTLIFAAHLRVGEVCALNFGDWNPATKELTVSRSYTNRRELKATKSKLVKTLVPLAMGIEVLEGMKMPRATAWADMPMFTGEGRKRLHPAVLRQNWDRARRMAMKPDMRTYDTRHISITTMGEAGLPPHVIMARAGHTNFKTTSRYLHSSPDRSAADAAQIDRYLNDRLGE